MVQASRIDVCVLASTQLSTIKDKYKLVVTKVATIPTYIYLSPKLKDLAAKLSKELTAMEQRRRGSKQQENAFEAGVHNARLFAKLLLCSHSQ